MSDPFLRLVSDNEQDRSECLRWWREASQTDKISVWDAIQRPYDDPTMEIVARFAQLAFGEMVEETGGSR